MTSFEQKIKQAAEDAVVKAVSSGEWLKTHWDSKMLVPTSVYNEVWAMVDVEKVKKHLAGRIEQELADRVINHLAAEISTDIKQLLGNQERREALRAVARENLDRICKK